MLNVDAPIVPYEGIGEISLYSSEISLKEFLSNYNKVILPNGWIRYDIEDYLQLFFHPVNNKLFKMCTQPGYRGYLLDNICTSTHESDFQTYDSEIMYDEFEEVWESPKGYFIETDVETFKANWITVYIPEFLGEDFWKGNW